MEIYQQPHVQRLNPFGQRQNLVKTVGAVSRVHPNAQTRPIDAMSGENG